MKLGRVVGSLVASQRVPRLEGVRWLLLQPLDRQGRPAGALLVAADAIHTAGPGDHVTYVGSREAAQAMPDPFVPVDHAVVGLVDAVAELGPEGDE